MTNTMARNLFSVLLALVALPQLSGCSQTASKNTPEITAHNNIDYVEINESNPGQPIDFAPQLVSGKYTIIDYYSPYCGPCMRLRPSLQYLTVARNDVAVRSININRPGVRGIDWDSPIIKATGIQSLPHLIIFDPNKHQVSEGREASMQVRNWLHGLARRS